MRGGGRSTYVIMTNNIIVSLDTQSQQVPRRRISKSPELLCAVMYKGQSHRCGLFSTVSNFKVMLAPQIDQRPHIAPSLPRIR